MIPARMLHMKSLSFGAAPSFITARVSVQHQDSIKTAFNGSKILSFEDARRGIEFSGRIQEFQTGTTGRGHARPLIVRVRLTEKPRQKDNKEK